MDFFNISFWQGFVGNLLATIIGVALGIPVAFWINRRVENSIEQEKKEKILRVLSVELSENRNKVAEWIKTGKMDLEMITLGALMTDEVWNTFSDGGELEWIKDPFLLGYLSSTYAEIKRIKYLSDKYLDIYGQDSRLLLYKDISNQLWVALDDLSQTITSTLDMIDYDRGVDQMTYEEWSRLKAKRKGKRTSDPGI